MIIECTACHARFRLDETKIKGKGARVRCRRCGESITVFKTTETGEPPPQKPASKSLDLRSIVRDTLGERPETPAAPPPATESAGPPQSSSVEPSPATGEEAGSPPERIVEGGFPPETAVEESPPPVAAPPPDAEKLPAAPPAGAASPKPKDEVDAAFEEYLVAPVRVPVPAEEELPPETPAEASAEAEAASVEFQPEERMEIPDLEIGESRPEPSGKEMAAPEAPEPPDSGFLITSSESLGYLAREQENEPLQKALDISTKLREEPGTPEEPPAPPPVDSQARETETPPAESPPAAAPPLPRAKEAPVAVVPAKPRPPEPRKAAPSRIRPSLVALILVFLALAGGGAYLGFTKSGQETLRGMIPGMESLWLQGRGKPVVQYDIRNLIGYYERETTAGNLFIIKGQVTNVGRTRKTGTRVRAALLDANDNTLAERTCYAGNVIAGDELRTSSRERIDEKLSNRFGDGLVNMDVPPGKTIPFMLVFFDAPNGIDAYRLEAREGE